MAKPSSTIRSEWSLSSACMNVCCQITFFINSLPQSPQENSTFSSVSTSVYYQIILPRKCFSTVTARTCMVALKC